MPRKKIKGKGMKGMSIKSGDKRPTKQGAGLTAKQKTLPKSLQAKIMKAKKKK